ncbi:diguanylate cyclase [Gordonia sp. N1V]|uniref:diguanylate cyclase domain-containing protein n=1 Tax=Gordonia sp. N1V TaxID=3034163 RepID=UPI0023E0DD1D|nr:diguanylate cyclase [Gordonia sp. N1V]MDF3283533.1 diguanylate cyclase [Gordonia sp. N1V]
MGFASLLAMMSVAQQLGEGADLDDVLQVIARGIIEVIGFDAVAVNVRRDDGDFEVRAVVGPPELENLHGERMTESVWLELFDSAERWGGLYLTREAEMADGVASIDPWRERFASGAEPVDTADTAPGFLPPAVWEPEFALLVPVYADEQLQAVISVDLPRSGMTPDPEQQALLELFGVRVGIALTRVTEAGRATDRVRLYRASFAESPLATALLDSRLRLIDVNDAFLQLTDAIPGEWEFVCTIADRTQARAELNAIRYRADHDGLTGLTVREVWLDELNDRLRGQRTGVLGVLICDLDGFKEVNDTSGHVAGDAVLRSVAEAMLTAAHRRDVVCRWGGDEFAVVCTRKTLTEVNDLAAAIAVGVRGISTSASASDPVSGLGISIGIAALENPEPTVSSTTLVDVADGALYRAKVHPTQRWQATVI